jgi:DNA-binding MarR family transcriptional regulator
LQEKNQIPHIGRLARFIYFEMMQQSQAKLDLQGYDDIKAAHNIVFQFIGEGKRMTEIAQLANTTKQNMKYLLEYLEERAYVSRRADETDKRAVIFFLTEKGRQYYQAAALSVQEIEQHWASLLGEEVMISLKILLNELQLKILANC